MGHRTEENSSISLLVLGCYLLCFHFCWPNVGISVIQSSLLLTVSHVWSHMKSYCIYATQSWGKKPFKESRATFTLWWQCGKICLKGCWILMLDVLRWSNYWTHSWPYLLIICAPTALMHMSGSNREWHCLKVHNFQLSEQVWEQSDLTSMKQHQFISAVALTLEPEDETQAIRNIPIPSRLQHSRLCKYIDLEQWQTSLCMIK